MKIGIVGSGFMGRTHIEGYKNCGISEFCVCDTNLENAKKLADQYGGKAYADFDEMLNCENLDAVSICVPTPFHNPIAIKALEKGVAVLCEKPFASSSQAAEEIVNKSKETGTPLMVAHVLRFMKPYYFLKKIVEEKRFGELLCIDMKRHSTAPLWGAGNWLMDAKKSGGAIVDMHTHETDIAISLFGKPKYVTTVGSYMQCSSVYGYDNVGVSIVTSWRKPKLYPFTSGYDANFENASVIFDGEKVVIYTDDEVITDALEKEVCPEYINGADPYENEIRYFLNGIKTGDFSYCNPDDSLLTIKTIYAGLESMESKQPVNVDF
ncbi:MAG: Gfo/Idh/MocA family oxidoreductase [Ruminococcaceae bacterium]|nr:Gfo/Idh/MocA family oxidoreductase [Oscillospiraceae bacterium]